MSARRRFDDPEWARLVRHRALVEHRINALGGLLEGRRIAQAPDRGLTHLAHWIEEAEELWEIWPVNRVRAILAPLLDPDFARHPDRASHLERMEQALTAFSGPLNEQAADWARAPDAPYDEDTVVFPDHRFAFTGRFIGCTRELAIHATELLGGTVTGDVSGRTDFLIVGARCHPGWIERRRGRKIQKAVRLRTEKRSTCRIVREEHWTDAVIAAARAHRETTTA